MDVYKVKRSAEILSANEYPGRGIIIGKSAEGGYAAFAYFIMGRSENSKNRVFSKTEEGIIIYPYDPTKVKDPSLIIYSPIRKYKDKIIVTNGDQTDTVFEGFEKGLSFDEALESRCFEPDEPNYTPRISGVLDFEKGFCYRESILKSADPYGSACNRYGFGYTPVNGLGHFIHTYVCNGNPIPTFTGEPERVYIPEDFQEFSEEIWNNLNPDYKVSLYTCFVNLTTKEEQFKLYNVNA